MISPDRFHSHACRQAQELELAGKINMALITAGEAGGRVGVFKAVVKIVNGNALPVGFVAHRAIAQQALAVDMMVKVEFHGCPAR